MKASLFLLYSMLLLPVVAFPQKSNSTNALSVNGVYFTKPSRQDSLSVWSVRCLRFYADKTVILTSEIYPDQGFDMSRFGKLFNKENLSPQTARGTYSIRNDSLVFSTESHFTGSSKQHTIRNRYRSLKISPDTLRLERENAYSVKPDTVTFYFRSFLNKH